MKIDVTTVKKIAHLARLTLNPKEGPILLSEMEQILTWMEKLMELDTSNVRPLAHMSLEINALREDRSEDPLAHTSALKHAPNADSDFFLVPKMMENE